MRALNHRRNCLPHSKKPTLSSRISLETSREHDHLSSAATNLSHSFLKPSGSTCSAEMPSTSTMSSPISTLCPTTPTMWLNLEKTSNSSMVRLCQLDQSRPMETGSLPGTAWPTPCYLSSAIGNKSFKPMASTSSIFSPPYHLNSTAESLTTTKLFASELLNNKTSNSQISLVSMTCKSSGSVTQSVSPLVNLHIQKTKPKKREVRRDDAVQPVEDGTITDALMQPPVATTYTSVPNALIQTMLATVVTPQTRND